MLLYWDVLIEISLLQRKGINHSPFYQVTAASYSFSCRVSERLRFM